MVIVRDTKDIRIINIFFISCRYPNLYNPDTIRINMLCRSACKM